jgi:WD40 repeat protein
MCLDISSNQWLLASGSENGIVTLWDFQQAKVNGVFHYHSSDVLCLRFADPYPILVSASTKVK